jgi:hypothetical protein
VLEEEECDEESEEAAMGRHPPEGVAVAAEHGRDEKNAPEFYRELGIQKTFFSLARISLPANHSGASIGLILRSLGFYPPWIFLVRRAKLAILSAG